MHQFREYVPLLILYCLLYMLYYTANMLLPFSNFFCLSFDRPSFVIFCLFSKRFDQSKSQQLHVQSIGICLSLASPDGSAVK